MALILRTCAADGSSHNGFVWPDVGGVAVAPDWDAKPACGGGLHGLLWGEGDGDLLNWSDEALWLVAEVDEWIDLDGKVKFPRATVAYRGDRDGATTYIAEHGGVGRAIVGSVVIAGYRGTATVGYRGTATVGDGGTAIAGDYGVATAGDYGTATAGDVGVATAGYRGTATVGYRGTATVGYRGTATAGDYGTATVGNHGIIQIVWHDGKRRRIATGYIGEHGLLLNTPYKLDDAGAFVQAEGKEDGNA